MQHDAIFKVASTVKLCKWCAKFLQNKLRLNSTNLEDLDI